MTPVSFVKTTESYEVCRLGHVMKTGLINSSDQTVRAVHSCNSLFVVTFQTVRLQPGKIQTYFIHK